jgi:hypothetical protein
VTRLAERLRELAAPGEREAGERSWPVVAAAFRSRETAPPRARPGWRSAALAAAAAAFLVAAVAAAATPAGRDAVRELRRAVGIETAKPVLTSLPARGRVLVAGPRGAWVMAADGSARRLGGFREASWSPLGRFVVVVGSARNELAAVEPEGAVRWTLARAGPIRLPRWGGSATNTRIAYLAGRTLRVVAGDGMGDRLLASRARAVSPSWRPGPDHVLTYVTGSGSIVTVDADSGRVAWRWRPPAAPLEVEWAPNGRRLLVRAPRFLWVLDPNGRVRYELLRPPAAPIADATFAGTGVAFVQWADGGSSVWLLPRLVPDRSAARRLFEGAGRIDAVEASPDGRWLLLPWPSADQWLFLRASRRPRIEVAGGIGARLGDGSTVAGWCC